MNTFTESSRREKGTSGPKPKAAASPPLPAPRAGNLPLAARPGRQARRVHAREKVYNSCNAAGPPPGTLLPGHARLARPGTTRTTERRDTAHGGARNALGSVFLFTHSRLHVSTGAEIETALCILEFALYVRKPSRLSLGFSATFPNLSSNDKPMQENRGSSPRIFAQSPDLDKIDSWSSRRS